MLMILFSSQMVFADIKSIHLLPAIEPERSNASTVDVFTSDRADLDLQNQIDELTKKNNDLAYKIFQLENKTADKIKTQVVGSVDTIQVQRIDTLEKKVGLLEKTMQVVGKTMQNTLNLLTQLLNLLK